MSKKVALIIGNGDYLNTAKLKNPVNDSKDVKSSFEKLGFEIIYSENLTHNEFKNSLKTFRDVAKNSDVAVFYYAGHGLQLNGENYLLPVDSDIRTIDDIEIESLNFKFIEQKFIETNSQNSIFILDACRDNPFEKQLMSSSNSRNSVLGRGLANPNMIGGNSIIAYSTSPNDIAFDNPSENNGIYTKYLKKFILETNISIESVFKKVAKHVNLETQQKQKPWVHSNTHDELYLNGENSQKSENPEYLRRIEELENALKIKKSRENELISLESEVKKTVSVIKNSQDIQKLEDAKAKLEELNSQIDKKYSEIESISLEKSEKLSSEKSKNVFVWNNETGKSGTKINFKSFIKTKTETRDKLHENEVLKLKRKKYECQYFAKPKPIQGEFETSLQFQIREIEYQQEKLRHENEQRGLEAKFRQDIEEKITRLNLSFDKNRDSYFNEVLNNFLGKQKIEIRC